MPIRCAADDVVPLLGQPSSLRFLTRSLLARAPAVSMAIEPPNPEVAQQPASALIRRPAGDLPPETTLREAARLMDARAGELRSSSTSGMATTESSPTATCARKVVAGRLSSDDPVSAAMTTPVVGVAADQTGADVMLAMIDHDIRHVPVFSARSEVLGVIVAIDLVAAETGSPFVLRRAIARAKNKGELSEAASRLNSTVVALHRAELAPVQISERDLGRGRCADRTDDRAGDRIAGPAARRVLLDVAGQPRQARARIPRRTSTRGWRGGTCPRTIPLTSEARRRLASHPDPGVHARDRGQRVRTASG